MNKKVTILVACHKPAKVFSSEVYTPIHVGRAVSKCTDLMQDMIGDDTGDNISALNPYYCELTAQYWAWKNLDCEYVGLCHYRRYFEKEITVDNVEKVMNGADVLLLEYRYSRFSLLKVLACYLIPEEMMIFYIYMKQYHEDIFPEFDKFFAKGYVMYPCNMFLCKKTIFDDFAKWQFGILEDLRKIYRFSGYSHCNRVLGYIAENLLPFYMIIKGYKIKTMHVEPSMDVKEKFPGFYKLRAAKTRLMHIIQNPIFKPSKDDFFLDEPCLIGLKLDGILDQDGNLIMPE